MTLKLNKITPDIFNTEMQKIQAGVSRLITLLQCNYGKAEVLPTPAVYADGTDPQPFPLALDILECWRYAAGTGPRPEGWADTAQATTELLWGTIGNEGHGTAPAAFWQSPLGLIFRACETRDRLEAGLDLTADQLALLSSTTRQAIQDAITRGAIKAKMVDGRWAISAKESKFYLDNR